MKNLSGFNFFQSDSGVALGNPVHLKAFDRVRC